MGGLKLVRAIQGRWKCFTFIFPRRNVDTASPSNKRVCISHAVSDINFWTEHTNGRGGPSIIGWRLLEDGMHPTVRIHKTFTFLSFITHFSGSQIRNKQGCLHSLLDKCVFLASANICFLTSALTYTPQESAHSGEAVERSNDCFIALIIVFLHQLSVWKER